MCTENIHLISSINKSDKKANDEMTHKDIVFGMTVDGRNDVLAL